MCRRLKLEIPTSHGWFIQPVSQQSGELGEAPLRKGPQIKAVDCRQFLPCVHPPFPLPTIPVARTLGAGHLPLSRGNYCDTSHWSPCPPLPPSAILKTAARGILGHIMSSFSSESFTFIEGKGQSPRTGLQGPHSLSILPSLSLCCSLQPHMPPCHL